MNKKTIILCLFLSFCFSLDFHAQKSGSTIEEQCRYVKSLVGVVNSKDLIKEYLNMQIPSFFDREEDDCDPTEISRSVLTNKNWYFEFENCTLTKFKNNNCISYGNKDSSNDTNNKNSESVDSEYFKQMEAMKKSDYMERVNSIFDKYNVSAIFNNKSPNFIRNLDIQTKYHNKYEILKSYICRKGTTYADEEIVSSLCDDFSFYDFKLYMNRNQDYIMLMEGEYSTNEGVPEKLKSIINDSHEEISTLAFNDSGAFVLIKKNKNYVAENIPNLLQIKLDSLAVTGDEIKQIILNEDSFIVLWGTNDFYGHNVSNILLDQLSELKHEGKEIVELGYEKASYYILERQQKQTLEAPIEQQCAYIEFLQNKFGSQSLIERFLISSEKIKPEYNWTSKSSCSIKFEDWDFKFNNYRLLEFSNELCTLKR